MQFTNTKYNTNVTTYVIGLLEGYITQDEFELLAMIRPSQSKCNYTC